MKHGFPTDFKGIPEGGSNAGGCNAGGCSVCLDGLSGVDIIHCPVLRGVESTWQCLLQASSTFLVS